MRFRKNVTRTVYGFIEVNAKDEKEAEKKFEDGDYDMFDNKSDEEYGEWSKG